MFHVVVTFFCSDVSLNYKTNVGQIEKVSTLQKYPSIETSNTVCMVLFVYRRYERVCVSMIILRIAMRICTCLCACMHAQAINMVIWRISRPRLSEDVGPGCSVETSHQPAAGVGVCSPRWSQVRLHLVFRHRRECFRNTTSIDYTCICRYVRMHVQMIFCRHFATRRYACDVHHAA